MGNAAFGLGLFCPPEALCVVHKSGLLQKETSPDNGNWERGTVGELEQAFPGALSGLSAEELLAAALEGCGRERQ